MSFDPMAAAIDWLDAYRAADLEAIVSMHADSAVVYCKCCVSETIASRARLRAFWQERFLDDCVPSELRDIQPASHGTSISFVTPRGLTTAVLHFDADGKIANMEWGPLSAP
ncbi:nuclear transport factor 2 family protein [Bradyrhizobium tropiciagri]|uniref:nuclear transport factor 2 family protein n=1 Tax=Bradyrhizobium tropiciagri TaxID=312253 RepID=UPI001BA550C4|nr:nuclear transport factor 2 family protein [Bradyrhizobium tropiciagri]MBR0872941.1 nuclear transport factor 2 family protein [Bradyrhizobium tropiciagri]